MSLHISVRYYPPASQKNTSSNVSKGRPSGHFLVCGALFGGCDHCRRDVFSPYILVERDLRNKNNFEVKVAKTRMIYQVRVVLISLCNGPGLPDFVPLLVRA
jgi:hypothetical protein